MKARTGGRKPGRKRGSAGKGRSRPDLEGEQGPKDQSAVQMGIGSRQGRAQPGCLQARDSLRDTTCW